MGKRRKSGGAQSETRDSQPARATRLRETKPEKERFFSRRPNRREPPAVAEDLKSLSAWALRLENLLRSEYWPKQHLGMIFRPDQATVAAMMRLSARFHYMTKHIDDVLTFAEIWFSRISEGDAAEENFGSAIASLRYTINTAVTTITADETAAAKPQASGTGDSQNVGGGATGDRQPKSPRTRKKRRARIRVAKDNCSVTVDGKVYRLNSNTYGLFIRLLLKNRGQSLKATSIEEETHRRCDRIYAKLPKAIQKLIDKPGRGHTGYILP